MKAALLILIGVLLGASAQAVTLLRPSHDPFVRFLETQAFQGFYPGRRVTLVDCGTGYGCTILYRGTEVEGSHYKVLIDKLD